MVKWNRKLGLRRTRTGPRKKSIPDDFEKQWKEEGLTIDGLAAHYGVSTTTISVWKRKLKDRADPQNEGSRPEETEL